MVPYQSFQPNIGQFQNQMYYQPQPMYMERLSQLQAQQAQIQGFSTMGKIVESIDIVKSTDIPMDGNLYYFPKADGSEIYAKRWLPNGQTQILAFKPVNEEQQSSIKQLDDLKLGLSDEAVEAFMIKFDEVLDRMDKLEKSIKPSNRKKEVVADE